jgi:hypothetical protein
VTPMDSLVESVVAKRDELAALEKQTAERKARIAAAKAAPKKDWKQIVRELEAQIDAELEAEGNKPEPPKPLTEAEKEQAAQEMQRTAFHNFHPPKFPADGVWPEGVWRPTPPPQIPPEPTEDEINKRSVKRVGPGQVGIVSFGPDSKLAVRVLTVADEHGNFKATGTSGPLVGQVVLCNVEDFQ